MSGQRVESLMAKKGKEAAVLLRKYLKEALRCEGIHAVKVVECSVQAYARF